MVSEQNEKAENVELSRLIKILGVLTTYTRILLMNGIRLARNKHWNRQQDVDDLF